MEFTHTRLFTSNCQRWGLQKILSNSEEKKCKHNSYKRDILVGVSNQFQCLFSGYK